jgi:hypothetical protein
VTPLPKKFSSLADRFTALAVLVVWAPLAAVVGATGGAILAVVLGLSVAVYAVFVMGRVGVVATTEGVVVHGYGRNRRLHWKEIDRFEIQQIRPNRAYVVLCSGSRVKMTGIGPTWILFHEHTMVLADHKVAALNAIRSQVLSGEAATSA